MNKYTGLYVKLKVKYNSYQMLEQNRIVSVLNLRKICLNFCAKKNKLKTKCCKSENPH